MSTRKDRAARERDAEEKTVWSDAPQLDMPAEEAKAPEPEARPARQPQISVREWALTKADEIGLETALAFVSIYGRDTGTAAELESALDSMRSRVVHEP